MVRILARFCALASLTTAGLLWPASAGEHLTAVRGVWLTNVDSRVLNSRANIERAVNLLDSLGFNTIFVVTWNKTMTSYPSAVMKQMTGVEIDTLFTGRDPLKELIEAAHRRNLKVIAWFEFGFSASYKQDGGAILKARPDWAAVGADGRLVTKNGFDWMNGFQPEVQDFLLSLIMEVVTRYDVDGIQGDDRLPAMPCESGYDPYTTDLYASQHGGKRPPRDFRDPGWIQWRADLMTAFMERIHRTVKSHNRKLIVSMSPSIYPFAKEEYLQDWPEWMKRGLVDMVHPQLYRYGFADYARELKALVRTQLPPDQLSRCSPGVLLKLGDYSPSKKFLTRMLEENRTEGINGEVMFFYEGVARHADVFRKFYGTKVAFPSIPE
jgi:uncharacterized lipoprotein YddW (UPF0748 family)